jgi:hypothetical protein
MGYLRDLDGIMKRCLKEGEHWNTHLENTRAFIASSFEKGPRGTVAVLGSGWLLDVPLKDLLVRFDRVLLVDIHHPPQIQRKFRDEERVTLLEADLSGGAVLHAWHFASKNRKGTLESFLEGMELKDPLTGFSPDALVSVNLLDQLDILLWDFLSAKGCFRDQSPESFRTRIQTHHLEWITSLPGCLVTDTREIGTDRSGKEIARPLLFAELPRGIRSESWTWNFDSLGTYRSGTRTHMEVQAVEWM